MRTVAKAIVTAFMWLILLGLIGVAIMEIGGLAIVLALVLMLPLLAIMAFMWVVDSEPARISAESRTETRFSKRDKRKRQNLDALINDLSDEQIEELRRRLGDVDYTSNNGRYAVRDDGELVNLRR
ncbi:MAG: hypothetical protein KC546_18875 [Anaerolineae bacterium]|nr:hypothetical protein [Anaerolineae bacterium]MCA9890455.1 hypothetical protein [Anaerolineae bacterium]